MSFCVLLQPYHALTQKTLRNKLHLWKEIKPKKLHNENNPHCLQCVHWHKLCNTVETGQKGQSVSQGITWPGSVRQATETSQHPHRMQHSTGREKSTAWQELTGKVQYSCWPEIMTVMLSFYSIFHKAAPPVSCHWNSYDERKYLVKLILFKTAVILFFTAN